MQGRPEKDEAPTVAGSRLQVLAQSVSHHFASDDAQRKVFEEWRARLAFHGYALARSNPLDGCVTYWATRWGLCRELKTLTDVGAFTAQIGG